VRRRVTDIGEDGGDDDLPRGGTDGVRTGGWCREGGWGVIPTHA
jgi:hypothetical protein